MEDTVRSCWFVLIDTSTHWVAETILGTEDEMASHRSETCPLRGSSRVLRSSLHLSSLQGCRGLERGCVRAMGMRVRVGRVLWADGIWAKMLHCLSSEEGWESRRKDCIPGTQTRQRPYNCRGKAINLFVHAGTWPDHLSLIQVNCRMFARQRAKWMDALCDDWVWRGSK